LIGIELLLALLLQQLLLVAILELDKLVAVHAVFWLEKVFVKDGRKADTGI